VSLHKFNPGQAGHFGQGYFQKIKMSDTAAAVHVDLRGFGLDMDFLKAAALGMLG